MAHKKLLSADDILKVAVQMVEQGEADGLSLRAVARALGVKAPSLYRYFADKGALELAVAEEALRRMRGEVEPAAAAVDPKARIMATANAYLHFTREHYALYSYVFQGRVRAAYGSSEGKALWNTLLEACHQLSAKLQAPDSGSLKGDLEMLANAIVGILRSPRSTVLPSIIDAGERDEELAQLQSREFCGMEDAFRSVIERGKQRGELPSRENAQELILAILGPLFFRRWFSREDLDETVARRVVARALRKAD